MKKTTKRVSLEEVLPFLGKYSDYKIAKMFNCNYQTIFQFRKTNNIPHAPEKLRWQFDHAAAFKFFGKKSDSAIARQFGVSWQCIQQLRKKQGISKYSRSLSCKGD